MPERRMFRDGEPEQPPPPTPPTPEASALAAYHAGDPDSVPHVRIRSAYRDLSCKQSGPEEFRRVRYPGLTEWEWPDGERLPAIGVVAASRRASAACEVPVGTLVARFEREVYRGRRGRCSVRFALVAQNAEGKAELIDLKHRTLRKRPVYEITLPDSTVTECPRHKA